MSDFEAALRWYGVLLGASLVAAPLVAWLCAPLADRGATILRPLSWLVAFWPAWFAAAVGLPFGTGSLLAAAVVVAVGGFLLARPPRSFDRGWLRTAVVAEVAFVVLFALGLWLRGFTPDLTGTEKPMDVAFLASSAITPTMPPANPWFAGIPINYYYLGYAIFGSFARVAGIPATTAFNLAVATLFATAAVAAAGFAWNALRPWYRTRLAAVGAVLAGYALAVAGNLYAPLQLLRGGRETIEAWWWDSAVGIGWRSSRIVCDGPRVDNACRWPSIETINEFPFFSFLLGDLHPHVMALPLAIASLTVALAWLVPTEETGSKRQDVGRAAIAGAVVGSLYAANSWDYPTYLVALLGALLLARRRARRWGALLAGVAVVTSLLAWLPFWLTFVPPTGAAAGGGLVGRLAATVGVHVGERTSLVEYLTMFGVPVAMAIVLMVPGGVRATPPPAVVGVAAGAVAAAAMGAPVAGLGLLGVSGAFVVGRRAPLPSPKLIVAGLFGLGFALSAAVEVFYIRDVFESRMNTLFKVYYQVWTVFMLAASVAAIIVWGGLHRPAGRLAIGGLAALTVAAMAVYPMLASWQWTDGFAGWRGLDGIGYLDERFPDEAAAIRWLQANGSAGQVVVEAAGCSYMPIGDMPLNRVSAYTGLPTVVGWEDHLRQWHAGQPAILAAISSRQAAVADVYANPNGPSAAEFDPTWLYVGRYEAEEGRRYCPVAGPYAGIEAPGFPGQGWTEAFRSGSVAVYRRTEGEPATGVDSPSSR